MNTINSINITDTVHYSQNSMSRLNRFFASLLNDERNLPFVHFGLLVMLTTVPCGVLLFIPGVFEWWLVVPYFFLNVIFMLGPFILMQHNVAHNTLFKRKYKFLNHLIPWVMGPFYGITPETYYAHHVGMHHPENNLPPDLSCTMKFQRDNPGDFLKYFLRFFFWGIPELSAYLSNRKRKKILIRMLAGEGVYALIVFILLFVNWKATVAVFILPLVFTRFMMMAGNWAQHAFIDLESPDNCFRNSITCINSSYNKKCWNDGYHIAHHLHPTMHWTEMPGEFLRNIEKYKMEDSLVFRKVDYFNIWLLLMTKSYKTLSKFYVELNTENPRSKEEVIDLLKKRARKFSD